MGSRRDDYTTRDPIRSDAEPKSPSLGDVLTKRPEPTRGKVPGKMTLKPLPPKFVKGKKP
jgi:hypothetical protein